MSADVNPTDNGQEEEEEEYIARYMRCGGWPTPISPELREFMRGVYDRRRAEKAAQTGRCDGMRPAPVTPGVGLPACESVTSRERRCAQAIEAMRVADLANEREKP